MASPQTENGYTRIAHEVLEALYKINLSPYESRILMYILRNTWGRQKKMGEFSLPLIARETGVERGNVGRALRSLIKQNIVVANNGTYGPQKDYEKWALVSPKTQGVSKKTLCLPRHKTVSPKTQNRVSQDTGLIRSKGIPLIDNRYKKDSSSLDFSTKGNGTSESTLEESFNHFWNFYPIKTAKGAALRAWKKLKPDSELQAKILAAIKAQIRWREERAGDPKLFTPEWKHPTTWLNAMAWTDEVDAGENAKVKIPFYCNRCGTSHPEKEHTK